MVEVTVWLNQKHLDMDQWLSMARIGAMKHLPCELVAQSLPVLERSPEHVSNDVLVHVYLTG